MESKSGRLAAKAGCPLSGGAVKMERPQKRTIAGRNMFCFPKRMIASEEPAVATRRNMTHIPDKLHPNSSWGILSNASNVDTGLHQSQMPHATADDPMRKRI